MKSLIIKISKSLNKKNGVSLVTLGFIVTILIVLALIAGGLTWYFTKDAIQAKKEQMYISDRNVVQEKLLNAVTQVQQKYNVTVVITPKDNISSGIVYELKGLNNSAITGGKIGWKTKATDATPTQDTSIVLGMEMPVYGGVNAVWSTDSYGNVVLKINGKEYTAPAGTNLNSSLKNSSSSLGNGTNKMEEARLKKIPYVPTGFSHIPGTTIENGYIIQDSQTIPNQYVWVPVSDMKNWPAEVTEYYSKEAEEYLIVRRSVETYGGFYIGRFEASNDNLRASSRIDQKPWTNVTWSDTETEISGGASYYARQVRSDYGYVDLKSCLVYESQWKDILDFMNKADDTDSALWGNYMDSSFNIARMEAMYAQMNQDWALGEYQKVTSGLRKEKSDYKEDSKDKKFNRGGWITTTGITNQHCIKNIYDIAGNVSEWTMGATSKDSRNIAGGSYKDIGNKFPASKFEANKINEKSEYIGFRVALYL